MKHNRIHLFMRVSKQIMHSKRENLEKLDLYRGQPRMLLALDEQDGIRKKEIGQQLEIRPATVTKMVQRLEHSGFVSSRQDDVDCRVSRVYLTDKGKGIIEQLNDVYGNYEKLVYGGLTEDEADTLERLLTKVYNNIKE